MAYYKRIEPFPGISHELWTKLNEFSSFYSYWRRIKPPYIDANDAIDKLTTLGYRCELDSDQVLKMLRHWSADNGVGFAEGYWRETKQQRCRVDASYLVCDDRFIEYRHAVLETEGDPRHPDFPKLLVSYCITCHWPTLEQLIELTGLPDDVVKTALQSLMSTGKISEVEGDEDGEPPRYKSLQSFYWDKLQPTKKEVWVCETLAFPPETYSRLRWHQESIDDKTGANEIMCFNLKTRKHDRVLFDVGQEIEGEEPNGTLQRIINFDGDVVTQQHGTPLINLFPAYKTCLYVTNVNGNKLDCRSSNLIGEDSYD
jgi:hypothetical protein